MTEAKIRHGLPPREPFSKERRAYCKCGAAFLVEDCATGKVPEHYAHPSSFDPPGCQPARCVDSGTAPGHVGPIV